MWEMEKAQYRLLLEYFGNFASYDLQDMMKQYFDTANIPAWDLYSYYQQQGRKEISERRTS